MFDMHKRNYPKQYIEKAINLLAKIKGRTIVEIGSVRQNILHDLDNIKSCCSDGHSSLLFGRTGLNFWSVDINPENTAIANGIFRHGRYSKSHAITDDGIKFLKNYYGERIDLLFLDAWDVDQPGSAESHLEAYKAAKPVLSDRHIILIDDTDVDFINGEFVAAENNQGGKGKLLIPFLLSQGYYLVFSERQTMLTKNIPLEMI